MFTIMLKKFPFKFCSNDNEELKNPDHVFYIYKDDIGSLTLHNPPDEDIEITGDRYLISGIYHVHENNSKVFHLNKSDNPIGVNSNFLFKEYPYETKVELKGKKGGILREVGLGKKKKVMGVIPFGSTISLNDDSYLSTQEGLLNARRT